jgi:uncharacterized RDD family membrane protein YckC
MSQYGSPPDPEQPGTTPPTPPGGSGAPQDPYAAPPPPQNPYGAAPADPYGAPPPAAANPYGAAPANPYGGTPAYGGAQTAPMPTGGYAPWIKRVGAYLIDGLLGALAAIPLWIGYAILLSHIHTTTNADGTTTSHMSGGGGASIILILIGIVTSLGFAIWNQFIRQGRTGYSIGKGVLGIKLIDENTGAPVGALMAFLRQIVHVLDSLACYIGWLWPLWDRKSQTFADKIMHTVVVNQPQGS